MMFMEAGRFIKAITPALISFGQFLFNRYGGRSDLAVAALKKLEDRWEGYEKEVVRIDEEFETLKREGK